MSVRYSRITMCNKKGDIVDVICGFDSLEFIGNKRIKIVYTDGDIEILKIKKYESIFIEVLGE